MGTAILSPAAQQRLLTLVDDIACARGCDPDGAVTWLEHLVTEGAPPPRPLHEFAEGLRHVRMRRSDRLGDLGFRDPAWDMLLELYVSHCRGITMFVSNLCFASGVPSTTALRYLERLEKLGQVEREPDRSDTRRVKVRIAPQALPPLEGVLRRMQACA